MTQTLYISGAEFRDVIDAAYQIPAICAGTVPEYAPFAAAFAATVGNAFLANVKRNYDTMSRAETGFDGTVWVPNKRATVVAKVNKHKGALKGKSNRALAFKKRYEEYLALVRTTKKSLRKVYVTSKDKDKKKEQEKLLDNAVLAAVGQFAHVVRKEEGYDDVRAFQLTAILRDTNRMFNSLSAGIEDQPYAGPDAEFQTFLAQPGLVTVGTKVIYAATHQHGDPQRGIPARPFFPEPGKIPEIWMEDMIDAAKTALAKFIREMWGIRL
jgi:hypothetical protein